MQGDAKRRFCEQCQLHVHNLSAMSAVEREQFVVGIDGRTCITYELRADGSMVTPPHWPWLLQPWQRLRAAGVALFAVVVPFLFSACGPRRPIGIVTSNCDAPVQPGEDDEETVSHLGVPVSSPITTGGPPVPPSSCEVVRPALPGAVPASESRGPENSESGK